MANRWIPSAPPPFPTHIQANTNFFFLYIFGMLQIENKGKHTFSLFGVLQIENKGKHTYSLFGVLQIENKGKHTFSLFGVLQIENNTGEQTPFFIFYSL